MDNKGGRISCNSCRDIFSGQAGLEVIVGKAALDFVGVAVRIVQDDIRQVDAVEHRIFHHCVVSHVAEDEFIADV